MHETPNDSGGWTAYGITLLTFRAWCISHGTHRFAGTGDLKIMPQSKAQEIAHTWYWSASHCDRLTGTLGIVLCDASWVSGPGNAIRWLQKVLKVEVDGIFGPETQGAADKVKAGTTVEQQVARNFTDLRNGYDSSLSNASTFIRGWTRRSNDCLSLALDYNKG